MDNYIINIITNILKEISFLWVQVAPYLLLGMFIAGIMHIYLGENFIIDHFGGRSTWSVFKATLLGVPLPVCSCGVIPLANSLKKEGANNSATLSFLVSTPTTGVDSILATYSLLGPLFAIFRPVAAFLSGWFVGLFNYLINPEQKEQVKKTHGHKEIKQIFRIKSVLSYSFYELAADIGKWLIIGTILGGIITSLIPENYVSKILNRPFLQYFVMLVIGIPLYVCATGSIPIAAALIGKGIIPGAALVFLIAGPATNTITLSFVWSKLGKKSFFVYLGSLILISLGLGWLFDFVWRLMGNAPQLLNIHHHETTGWVSIISGIILFILILNGLRKPANKNIKMKYVLNVPDITCKHCKIKLEGNIKEIKSVKNVYVDIESKKVHVDTDEPLDNVKKVIKDSGYSIK